MGIDRYQLPDLQSHAILVDDVFPRPQVFHITDEQPLLPLLPVDDIEPRHRMAERRISLLARPRIPRGYAESPQHTEVRQVRPERALRRHEPFIRNIFGMSLETERRQPFAHLIRIVAHRALRPRHDREQLCPGARRPAFVFVVGRDVKLRHAAVFDIFIALSVRSHRQVLRLPDGRAGQHQPSARKPIAHLRIAAEGIERRPGREVQHLGRHVAKQRMPRLPDKQCRLLPRQLRVGMADTQQRERRAGASEIHLQLRRRPYLPQHRPRHVHAEARIEDVEIPVHPRVQVLPVRVVVVVHRVEVEQAVHNLAVRPRIVKQIAANLPVKLIREFFVLSQARHAAAKAQREGGQDRFSSHIYYIM